MEQATLYPTNTEDSLLSGFETFREYYEEAIEGARAGMQNETPTDLELASTYDRLIEKVATPRKTPSAGETPITGEKLIPGETPSTSIVIQTKDPSRLLYWVIDQLSKQEIGYGSFAVTILHNGIENESIMPGYISELTQATGINLIEVNEALGCWGALNSAMIEAYNAGYLENKSGVFFHMDDDTAPISPWWMVNSLRNFDSNLGAMFFPSLYYGNPTQTASLLRYKLTTITAQAIRQQLRHPHLTDGMAGYRTSALFPRMLEWEGALHHPVEDRTALVTDSGHTYGQAFSWDSVFLTDPSRIVQKGGLLPHLARMAALRSGSKTLARIAKGSSAKMYENGEL